MKRRGHTSRPTVRFVSPPVSKPLNKLEDLICHEFERHVRNCSLGCEPPYRRLCARGSALAGEQLSLLHSYVMADEASLH